MKWTASFFAQSAEILAACYENRDDLDLLLDPTAGFAPSLSKICKNRSVFLRSLLCNNVSMYPWCYVAHHHYHHHHHHHPHLRSQTLPSLRNTSIFSPVSTTSTLPTSCDSCGTRIGDESGCECELVEGSWGLSTRSPQSPKSIQSILENKIKGSKTSKGSKGSKVVSLGSSWGFSDEEEDRDRDQPTRSKKSKESKAVSSGPDWSLSDEE